jgi:O-antigen/teichoic acid export membrane protein
MKHLTRKSFEGAAWLGSLKIVIKLFSLVKIVVAARILTPAEIGAFGMIMLPYGLAEVATESGINQALVQTRKDAKQYLSSAWLAFIARGVLIFAALWLTAPWVSRFFAADLTAGLRLVALTPLIKGLMNPGIVLLRKYLAYQREFWFQVLSSITESLTTIVLLLTLKSFVALPLGVVGGGAASLMLSFVFSRVNWTAISLEKIKELFAYGKWVTLGTLTAYVTDQGDDMLVGKVLGAGSLGYYQTAYKISNLPTTQGAGLIYQIIFPLFATIQTDAVRLKRGLIKAMAVTFGLSLGFAVTVWLAAPFAVPVLFGAAWLPMLPALNVLLIFGVMRPLISVSSALFDAVGQPRVATLMNLIKLTVLVILIWPLTRSWGLVGTAWAVVIAQAVTSPWYFNQLRRYFNKAEKTASVV